MASSLSPNSCSTDTLHGHIVGLLCDSDTDSGSLRVWKQDTHPARGEGLSGNDYSDTAFSFSAYTIFMKRIAESGWKILLMIIKQNDH